MLRALPFVLLTICCSAQHNTLTAEEKSAGWKLLFDGQTMNGWLDPAKKVQPGDAWAVSDGCLKTVLKPRIEEDLVSADSFGDFELAFDWKISERGNTGIKYRIQDLLFVDSAKNSVKGIRFEEQIGREYRERTSDRTKLAPDQKGFVYTVGFEFQLLDDARHPDALRNASHTCGALYGMAAPTAKTAKPAGEWNSARLVVRGPHVEHWINGAKVLDTRLDDPANLQGPMRRWGPAPQLFEMLSRPKPRGPISLQHHGDEVWFRNIKLRELP
jgi:hypothetical protein